MAVTTALVVGTAISAYSAKKQGDAAGDAADAQAQGAADATGEQRRQFDLSRADQMPWLKAGQGALGQINALNSGDFSSFKESPDYKFAFDQGMQGLDRGAAARGGLYSGGADADRISFGQGLASQNYNNYYNRLAGVAGVGQNAAQSLGGFGANAANQIGQNMMAAGNARASGYAGKANAWSNFGQSASGALGAWAGQQGQPANAWGSFTPQQDPNYFGSQWGQGWGG